MRVLMVIAVGAVLSLIGWHKARAFGEVPKSVQERWQATGNSSAPIASTPRAAVATWFPILFQGKGYSLAGCSESSREVDQVSFGCTYSYSYYSPNEDKWKSATGVAGMSATNIGPAVACPEGAAQIPDGRCECALGSKSVAGKCQPYQCAAKGSYTVSTQPDVTVDNVGPICLGGCTVQPASVKVATDGSLYATWPFVSQGQACGGKPVSSADPIKTGEDKIGDPPTRCGANMCPGSVNGASVCVACKETTVKGPSTSASAPPGETPQIPGAPAGTATQEQSTSCTQSSCTTTTIWKDGAGNETGRKSEEKGQESFCKENPDAAICKKGLWGGSCGAYSCDGDAVQCAIAQRIHKTACDWEQVDDVIKTRGEAAMSGGDRPEGHPFKEAAETSLAFSTVIDRSNPLGGGCPTDTVIAYAGRSWVIPWSQHCDKFQLIGNLMVGVCMLAAAFIVFRS